MNMLKALPAAIALLFSVGQAVASDAEGEYHGYFRAGTGTNSGGGSQACYGLEGAPKYRFGNECDLYGEFIYTKEVAKLANGSSFVGNVMVATWSPNSDIGKDNHLDLTQAYIEAKNLPMLQGASAWMGKRYYDRPDIHVLDFKYLQGDGVGGGVAGIQAGPGKLSYALFRNDVLQTVAATRHSFIYQGIPVNPDGSLTFDATIIRGDSQTSVTKKVESGWSLSAVHKQLNVLGGDNTLALQYGSGSGVKIGGTDTGAASDAKVTRLFDNMIWQFTPEFSGSLVGVWQSDQSGAGAGSRTWTTVGARPVYAFNDNFKMVMDLGHDNIKPAGGGDDLKLTKITLAPVLSAGKGFWARPELRAFVTYAKWNTAAQRAANAADVDYLLKNPGSDPRNSTLSSTGVFGGKTNGTSFGLQVEAWF
jgi:maltoporin